MCHLGKDSLLNKCHVRQMRKEEREGEREREYDVCRCKLKSNHNPSIMA